LELRLPVGEGLVVGVVDGFFGRAEPDQGKIVWRRGRLGEALGEGG
jgi:hypothetical protein